MTRVATTLAHGTASAAGEALVRGLRDKLQGQKPQLVLVFASTQQPLGELLPVVHASFGESMVLGSSSAGEFTEDGTAKGSACAVAVCGAFQVRAGLAAGLSQGVESTVREALSSVPNELEGYPHRTGLILLDPLSGNGEEATLLAASLLGDDVALAGGAAGDDLKMRETLVGMGSEVRSDAVVIATLFSQRPLGLGVCHGHQAMSGPLRVTRARGAVVYTINGRPAWEVWKEQTKQVAARAGIDPERLADDEVGGYLLRYEAGLPTGHDLKVRAPLSRGADQSITFATGIPEGAEIVITESSAERQVQSAREAARRARLGVGGKVAGAVVFDCICRNLILQEQFAQAVHALADELGQVPLAGFETYGEIGFTEGDMSGFHNTSTVVLAFPA